MIYDLFISYKSEDKNYATGIYDALKKMDPNINIFLSERTLKEIGEAQYTVAIEQAIKSSKNMVVVATNPEFFSSKWVNYEWRLFFHFQLNDKHNFYHNIITATQAIDYRVLPDALQLCENVQVHDYSKIYDYIKETNRDENIQSIEERQKKFLESSMLKAGWGNAVFFSSTQLADYESSITDSLRSVTIISHTVEQDAPGGALFETVEKNLLNGIKYNYIFLDANNARSILKKIYFGHSTKAKANLRLEKAGKSFWVLGSYANVTIYEYKDRPMDGYFRIKTEISKGVEKSIFIRLSERIIDRITNQIEEYRDEGEIELQEYGE